LKSTLEPSLVLSLAGLSLENLPSHISILQHLKNNQYIVPIHIHVTAVFTLEWCCSLATTKKLEKIKIFHSSEWCTKCNYIKGKGKGEVVPVLNKVQYHEDTFVA